MKYIGAHVSVDLGVSLAPEEAHQIGATAFALFTSPTMARWKVPPVPADEAEAFRSNCQRLGYCAAQMLPHAGFLLNLGNPDKQKNALSRIYLQDEMERCHALGLTMINFHPGAHMKKVTEEESLTLIADGLNKVLSRTAETGVKAVLENTAGQGTNIGYDLAHLASIIDRIEDKSRVGVCIDTAHAYAAGYDLATQEGYDAFWQLFDDTIGRDRLCGMHLNDSLRPLGSRIDRHESLGKGHIGPEAFVRLMRDTRTDDIPLILETPDVVQWAQEIAWLTQQSRS